MWQSKIQLLSSDRVQKVTLLRNQQQLAYQEVIELWQQEPDFCSWFSNLLAQAPFAAYFWETPPLTLSTSNQPFECVLVDSPQLARVQPNMRAFASYFAAVNENEAVISFSNLGNDALLVVPSPLADKKVYPHLATFLRHAPATQKQLLWQTVGKVLQQQLNHQPIWVSTSGLGVYWLHIRLDSAPKYYCFNEYKTFNSD